MNEPITLNGITLTERAIDVIACFQHENNEELNNQKTLLADLLVEVVQQNVGDDKWIQFSKALADEIDFLNCLRS